MDTTDCLILLWYFSFFFRLLLIECTEIPRVITALQQQNTAPEVQQYDADPYQTDSDGGGGGGGGSSNGRGEITIQVLFFFSISSSFQANKKRGKFPLKRILNAIISKRERKYSNGLYINRFSIWIHALHFAILLAENTHFRWILSDSVISCIRFNDYDFGVLYSFLFHCHFRMRKV